MNDSKTYWSLTSMQISAIMIVALFLGIFAGVSIERADVVYKELENAPVLKIAECESGSIKISLNNSIEEIFSEQLYAGWQSDGIVNFFPKPIYFYNHTHGIDLASMVDPSKCTIHFYNTETQMLWSIE